MKDFSPLLALVVATLLGSSASAQNTTTNRFEDAALRQRLVGTWTREDKPNLTNTVTVSFTFRTDGTYSNAVTSVVGSVTRTDYNTGNWEIQQGVLVWTMKRTSDADMPIGTVRRWTILDVDGGQLVAKSSHNERKRFERAK